MNCYTCHQTFTSPHTGKTYLKGTMIDQREFDELPYSESKRFGLTPESETFAFQSSVLFLEETEFNY